MTMLRWRRRKVVVTNSAVPEAECCARPNAFPHDGKCRWCPKHDGSSGVAETRYTDAHEYEDYSTDVRSLVLAKRRK